MHTEKKTAKLCGFIAQLVERHCTNNTKVVSFLWSSSNCLNCFMTLKIITLAIQFLPRRLNTMLQMYGFNIQKVEFLAKKYFKAP